jgi:alpha-1,6-mannosyltransferase
VAQVAESRLEVLEAPVLPPAGTTRIAVGWSGLAVCVASTMISVLRGPKGSQVPNVLLLTLAFLGFGVVVWAGRSPGALSRRAVVLCSAGLLGVACIVPPIQSGDVWGYVSYGRMVSKYHDSPFSHAPSDYAGDPIMARTAPIWATQSSIYGPTWMALSAPGTLLAGDSPLANRLWFSVMAALAVAMAMWLVHRETKGSVLALALLGVNPFIVVSVVNGAHNDAVVGLAVLAAAMLATRNRWVWCGLVLGLAVGIKLPAGLCVLAVSAWAWRWRGHRAAGTVAGVAAATTAALYLIAGGTSALVPIRKASVMLSGASIWRAARDVLLQPRTGSAWAQQLASVAGAVTIALALWMVWRYRTKHHPAIVIGVVVLLYGLISAYMLPWYFAWGLIPLAVAWRSRTALAVVAFAALLNLGYIPDPHAGSSNGKAIPDSFALRMQKLYTHHWMPMLELAAAALVLLWSTGLPMRWWARWRAPRATASATDIAR